MNLLFPSILHNWARTPDKSCKVHEDDVGAGSNLTAATRKLLCRSGENLMAHVRMTLKLEPEIMQWVRQEAKTKGKSMASIVVGAMEDYRAAQEHQERLIEAGITLAAK